MSHSSQKGLQNTLVHRESSNSVKGVTIHDEPQEIEPAESYFDGRSPTLVGQSPRVRRTAMSNRKLTGRAAVSQDMASPAKELTALKLTNSDTDLTASHVESSEHHGFLQRIMQWISEERAKRTEKYLKPSDVLLASGNTVNKASDPKHHDPGFALDKLEHIVAQYAAHAVSAAAKATRKSSVSHLRRGSIAKILTRSHSGANTVTSDTDGGDAIARIPHVEAVLDNTKTLSFGGGTAQEAAESDVNSQEQKNWNSFKYEILRLTHTLQLRGWKKLSYENASLISVERLSGALTNAVYVVRAPKDPGLFVDKDADGNLVKTRRLPKDLLLRIYGPQVEHLIDRDAELLILRRLAAKNIGPKLLGYFSNGRFEEFLHAKTLTAADLRNPDISKQIAKRMKELHEGIDLLREERERGPYVFINWDKWAKRVETVITWLDQQVRDEAEGKAPVSKRYTKRGYVCGAEWKVFKKAYDHFRSALVNECGGWEVMQKELVFAHNDTQYGNLMRLQPPEESPLMHAVNQHKQLVVIDFEYANANTPGLEFANHFTEWCYNYHDPESSHVCNTKIYPTPEEQRRFVRAYVMHCPQFAPSASSTPLFEGREKSHVPDFMLDARGRDSLRADYDEEERIREKSQESLINKLLHQTRLWRTVNHALWIAWGIVQAPIPELDDTRQDDVKTVADIHPHTDTLSEEVVEKREEMKQDRPEGRLQEEMHKEGDENPDEESFDHLGYSQSRAMFFWGDCIQMGIVKEEDLPEETRKKVKYVRY